MSVAAHGRPLVSKAGVTGVLGLVTLQLLTVGLIGSFAGGCVWACDSALNPMTADASAIAVLVTSAVRSFMRAPWFGRSSSRRSRTTFDFARSLGPCSRKYT